MLKSSALVFLLLAACAQIPDADVAAPIDGKSGPRRDPSRSPPPKDGFRGTPPATSRSALTGAAQLTWHGGKILAHPQVYNLFWGNAFAGAEAAERARYDGFLQAIDGSWDFVAPVTQYGVSPVKFLGSSILAYDPPAQLDDSALRAWLSWAILNHLAPWPVDGTLYQVFMPKGTQLTHGQESMCNNFCGYHGSYDDARINGGASIRYVALPRPDCNECSYAVTVTDRETVISSHEMSEATTDADVNNHQLGWYDDKNGEIGDICASAPKGSLAGYAVQGEWSNKDNGCVAPHDPSPDFQVGLTPRSLSLQRGATASIGLWTAPIAGFSAAVVLSASSPAGINVSFAQGTVRPDLLDAVSIAVDDGVDAGSYAIQLTAVSGALSHTEVLHLDVTAPHLAVLLQDGAESGLGSWQSTALWTAETTTAARTGKARFRAGPYTENTAAYLISQPMDLRGFSEVTLSFAMKAQLEDGYDFFTVFVTADHGATWARLHDVTGSSAGFPAWSPLQAIDLGAFAGESAVQVAFGIESDGSVNGWGVALDDVEVSAR